MILNKNIVSLVAENNSQELEHAIKLIEALVNARNDVVGFELAGESLNRAVRKKPYTLSMVKDLLDAARQDEEDALFNLVEFIVRLIKLGDKDGETE